MKRWMCLLAAACLALPSMGCLTATWSPDPTIRTQQLIMLSEQLRQSGQDLSTVLLLNQMSNLNPIPSGGP